MTLVGAKKKTPGGHDNESRTNVTPGDTAEDLLTEGRIPAPTDSLTQDQTGADGTTRKKKRKGMQQAAADASKVRDEELALLREHLAALQQQEKVAEMKFARLLLNVKPPRQKRLQRPTRRKLLGQPKQRE